MTLSYQIAQSLLQIKAIKLSPTNPFTWASGIKSPIYCDNRIALSHPEVRNHIQQGMKEKVAMFGEVNMISGVATAGIAHGAILADRLGLPFSYVRASAKSHGRQNRIEGEIPAGSKILVIEDLISTGGSSLEAVSELRENGYEVAGVLAIFDYRFKKAEENFRKSSCKYISLTDYPQLISAALDARYIGQEELNVLKAWNENPEGWYSNNF